MSITAPLINNIVQTLAVGTTTQVVSTPAWIAFETSSTMAAVYTTTTNAFVSTLSATTGLGATAATKTASTTTNTSDTMTATYTFTAATTAAVWGHVTMTQSTGGSFMSWYSYGAVQNLNSGDTLAATIQVQLTS
jgi:hypothetical protein